MPGGGRLLSTYYKTRHPLDINFMLIVLLLYRLNSKD